MTFCVSIFFFLLFKNNVIREQLDENSFRRCYDYFRKYHSENTWSQLFSRFFINNYDATWQQRLKDILQLNILWTSVSSLHQDIQLIIVCFSFPRTSLVFKFNLLLPQFIYRSTFWYCILKSIPHLYALFIRASKFSRGSMLFFCEDLQLQIVNIFLIFHETLVSVNGKNFLR